MGIQEKQEEEVFNQTRVEDNPGAEQTLGDDNRSLPSDVSVDFSHDPEPSNVSDFDEQKERLQLMKEADQQKQPSSESEDRLTLEKLRMIGNPLTMSQKVLTYLKENPLRSTFLKKQKGRLPYSVFRPANG